MKTWLNTFLRVNNRKKRHTPLDLMVAGYPMVDITSSANWKKLHELCQEQFKDPRGHPTYIWFGHRFFFLNQTDADLFRGLLYLL